MTTSVILRHQILEQFSKTGVIWWSFASYLYKKYFAYLYLHLKFNMSVIIDPLKFTEIN